jgi:hypothetical protein
MEISIIKNIYDQGILSDFSKTYIEESRQAAKKCHPKFFTGIPTTIRAWSYVHQDNGIMTPAKVINLLDQILDIDIQMHIITKLLGVEIPCVLSKIKKILLPKSSRSSRS